MVLYTMSCKKQLHWRKIKKNLAHLIIQHKHYFCHAVCYSANMGFIHTITTTAQPHYTVTTARDLLPHRWGTLLSPSCHNTPANHSRRDTERQILRLKGARWLVSLRSGGRGQHQGSVLLWDHLSFRYRPSQDRAAVTQGMMFVCGLWWRRVLARYRLCILWRIKYTSIVVFLPPSFGCRTVIGTWRGFVRG